MRKKVTFKQQLVKEGLLFITRRLEFLGDRVLGLALSDIIYNKFPEDTEGSLAIRIAYLAQTKTLAIISEKIDINNKNPSAAADEIEAFLGTIFINKGYEAVKKIINDLWNDNINDPIESLRDAKTMLQEHLQGQGKKRPVYELKSKEGPDHSPIFEIEAISPDDNLSACGIGKIKREAEQNAANALLKVILNEQN